MNEDFESQLQRRMTASAQALPYKADRSQAVRTRGRRRRIATQVASSLAAVVCLVGVASVANLAFDQPDNRTQVLGVPDSGSTGESGQDSSDSNDETEGAEVVESESTNNEQSAPGVDDDVVTVDGDDGSAPTETTTPNALPPAGECLAAPPLDAISVTDPGKTVVNVSTEQELQQAITELTDDTVVLLAPGTYDLSASLAVRANRVTIRGDSTRCDQVVLAGKGMDNPEGGTTVGSGIWTNSSGLKVQNLTIRDTYRHAIQINEAADQPQLYNLRLLDPGEAFIISNAVTHQGGVSNGVVDYVSISYTNGPPLTDHGPGIGLTNGVNILGGSGWVVSNSRFENLSAPDSADFLWNGAVQFDIGSSNNTVESNVFVNVDRAIASGVQDGQPNSSSGDLIRNNMIVMSPDLYSSSRKAAADAVIVVWDSPNTKVVHNTIITQGNTPQSIELRFDSGGSEIRNNLFDAPIRDRTGIEFTETNNVEIDDLSIFGNLASGDLHLTTQASGVVDSVPSVADAPTDFDGQARAAQADAGADEMSG